MNHDTRSSRWRSQLAGVCAAAALLCTAASAHAAIYLSNPRTIGSGGNDADWRAPTALFSIDESTGLTTTLPDVTLGGQDVIVTALALTAGGELYGFLYDNDLGSRLATIDTATSEATLVGAGSFFAGEINGAAFDRNGRLWVVDFADPANPSFDEFDIANLSLAGNGFLLPESANLLGGDITFDLDGQCYFIGTLSGNSQTKLYTCDVVGRSFTELSDVVTQGFVDNPTNVFSPSGMAFSLDPVTCEPVLMAIDGNNIDEVGRFDLTQSPVVINQTESLSNISYFFHPDLAGFPSIAQVPSCDSCGDGTVDEGEECDDGNTDDGDGCSSVCLDEPTPTCGDGIIDAGEVCDDGNTADGDGCSSSCAVEVDWVCQRAEFGLVGFETLAADEGDPPEWNEEDRFTVFQAVNADPSAYISTLPAQNVGEIRMSIEVEDTSDDDFIGFVLGFDQGEFTAEDAAYILIDWKQETQDRDQYGVGLRGMAASLINGAVTPGDLQTHTGAAAELARAATLGDTGWVDETEYEFALDYTDTRLTLYVDGVLEFDLTAADFGLTSFPSGNVGFYNFSQEKVRYRLLSPRDQSVCTFDPGICEGYDDALDADGDGIPDGCDLCAGADDTQDADGDGTPDACDLCAGSDDSKDADGDGVPDGCDLCVSGDDSLDADGDGTPDSCDLCANADDSKDADGDGTPDACDLCAADPENDADGDGVCEIDDLCPLVADPDQRDIDGDGIGDACDDEVRYGLQGGGCSASADPAAGTWLLLLLGALLSLRRRRRQLSA